MSKELTGIGIRFSDADSRGGNATLRMGTSRGTIDVTVGNSSVVITSGDVSNNVLLTGTITALDNLFRGATSGTVLYTSTSTGAVVFTFTCTDEDGIATVVTFGGTVATFAAPVVTMPSASLTADVDTSFTLHALTAWNITDADDADGYASMTIGITNGTLTAVTGTSGATVTDGTYNSIAYSNSSSAIRLEGTIESLRNFLQSPGNSTLTYTASSVGSKTLTVSVTDANGQTGSNTKAITVAAPPVVVGPSAFFAALTISDINVHGTGFSYTDADNAPSDVHTLLITTDTGRLTVVSGTSGVTVGLTSPSGGDATPASVSITGTEVQINSLLQASGTGTIVFHKTTAGTSTITVKVTDTTSRFDTATATVIMSATTTWTGYASATPTATTATISNFVYAVDLSLMPTEWWAAVTADGRDIRVTHPVLGVDTNLPRDLVHFSVSAKTGILFFQMPNSASPDTVKLWVGATSATAPTDLGTYGRENVYDSTIIRGWWPDGGGEDRTGYDNDFTAGASGPSAFGDENADFGLCTDYGSTNNAKYATTTIAVATDEPETFCAYVNLASRDDSAVLGATHDTKTNVLRVRNSKVQAKTYISTALGATSTETEATAVGDVAKGSWKFISASFLSDTSRVSYRDGGNIGSDTTSAAESGSAGDLYMMGATIRNPTTAKGSFCRGKIGLCFILTALDSSLIPVWISNYNSAFDQSSYWTTWAWSVQSQTGL